MALHEIAEFVDGHVPIAVNVHLCQDFFARGRTFYLLDVLFVSSMHRGVIRLGLYNEFSKLVHAACLVLYFSDDLSFLSPLFVLNSLRRRRPFGAVHRTHRDRAPLVDPHRRYRTLASQSAARPILINPVARVE